MTQTSLAAFAAVYRTLKSQERPTRRVHRKTKSKLHIRAR